MNVIKAIAAFWIGIFTFGTIFFIFRYIMDTVYANLDDYAPTVTSLYFLVFSGMIAIGVIAWAYRWMCKEGCEVQ